MRQTPFAKKLKRKKTPPTIPKGGSSGGEHIRKGDN